MKKLLILLLAATISTAVQAQTKSKPQTYICGAMTAKGTPCQIKVKIEGAKCFHHDASTPKCTAIKKDGTRCKNPVKAGQTLCHVHNK